MNWQDLFAAIALVFVIEGILPFLSPRSLRQAYTMVTQLDDRAIRTMGVISMGVGILLLIIVR